MNRGENTLLPDVCLETWTISYVAEQSILGSCAKDDTNEALCGLPLRAFRKLLSIYVFSYFPFGFEGKIWDPIVSVPDHCLSVYFSNVRRVLFRFHRYIP